MPTPKRGTLVLVVGPSGAGKDSLIAWCRAQFAGDASVVFPRRLITRNVTEGTEDHDTASDAAYADLVAKGDFALHWRAHGLGYGIPASIAGDLAAGRSVVVNVSRAVLDEARRKFPPVAIVSVTVPPALLAERLRHRRRESEVEIAGRLARGEAHAVSGPDVVALDNSGSIDVAGAALAAVIAGRSAGPRP
jgi:phosphonate metabolism protein PhnN/1,5-bisphosphokinase (PRPP-forming)